MEGNPNPQPYASTQEMHDRMLRGGWIIEKYAADCYGSPEDREDYSMVVSDLISDCLHYVNYKTLQAGGETPADMVGGWKSFDFELLLGRAGNSYQGDFEDCDEAPDA